MTEQPEVTQEGMHAEAYRQVKQELDKIVSMASNPICAVPIGNSIRVADPSYSSILLAARQALAVLPAIPLGQDDSGRAERVDLETAAKALAELKYDDNLGFCSTFEQCGDRERYAERYFRTEIRFARACAEAWGLIYTASPSRPAGPEQEGA